MSAIHDLLSQVSDEALRDRLEQEIDRITKTKRFGIVFEEHLPECTPLYDIPVKCGSTVAKKAGTVSDMYEVCAIKDGVASCMHKASGEMEALSIDELVCVAEFGEPIYPYLKPIDTVCNASDGDLWHTLIEADNYHALQLLTYLYPQKVDCIYIDPPYNTGARDWKYNNDYVDSSDSYRHSKWLSFIEKRLKLAKQLLNPNDSVLIITIDEKEYLHLGMLLEELFPEANIQMISTVINPAGASRVNAFSRTSEYIFCIQLGAVSPVPLELTDEWNKGSSKSKSNSKGANWDSLVRSGPGSDRRDRPNMFYPIFISETGKYLGCGNPLPIGVDRESVQQKKGQLVVWPLRSDGSEGRWRIGKETFEKLQKEHFVKLGGKTKRGVAIYYLKSGEQEKVKNGFYEIKGIAEDNSYILDASGKRPKFVPGDIWNISSHNASAYGSVLLKGIIGDRFSFPKSLYAVADIIRFYTENKRNALIVDFFAGSGTTMHSVNLLNARDEGNRRCIMVTNNEVSDEEAKALMKQGYKPGDDEWESLGIARYVTWPRTVCSIEGRDVKGNPLKGNYINIDIPMADGFKTNAAFFKLGFLDKTSVALGRQLAELFPVLWMKAGCHGPCPDFKDEGASMAVLPENRFAILINEKHFQEFNEEIARHPAIQTVYIITDSEAGYREMISEFSDKDTYQLYRDYLDNFRINTGR